MRASSPVSIITGSSLSDLEASDATELIEMRIISWSATRLVQFLLVALALGCSTSQNATVDSDRPKVHFPTALSQLANPTVDLQDLAQTAVNKTVHVEGTVTQQVPLIESSIYQISDKTGTVLVVSSEAPPEIGDAVRVRGVLQYEQIVIDGVDLGEYYLQEKSRSINAPDEAEE